MGWSKLNTPNVKKNTYICYIHITNLLRARKFFSWTIVRNYVIVHGAIRPREGRAVGALRCGHLALGNAPRVVKSSQLNTVPPPQSTNTSSGIQRFLSTFLYHGCGRRRILSSWLAAPSRPAACQTPPPKASHSTASPRSSSATDPRSVRRGRIKTHARPMPQYGRARPLRCV